MKFKGMVIFIKKIKITLRSTYLRYYVTESFQRYEF